MKSIAVFNNKGGVGKTSLVYHLAWMYARLDCNVLVADLDPQANLTSMFLNDEELEHLWADDREDGTIYTSLRPLLEGTGDVTTPYVTLKQINGVLLGEEEGTGAVTTPHVTEPAPGIGLVAGDMLLSGAEDELTSQWPDCLDRKPRAFRVLSAISRALHGAAEKVAADLILMDVGPNLGALNRAVLVNADHVVVPLAADLYSIRGLHNLGPTLRRWREEWSERRERNPVVGLDVPRGDMQPIGYVVLQHAVRLNRPVMAYERWMERIPGAYRNFVVGEAARPALSMDEDEHCLAALKPYRSLMPLAQEARKPMFALKPADGVIGGQVNAVQACYRDFRALARTVARRCGVWKMRNDMRSGIFRLIGFDEGGEKIGPDGDHRLVCNIKGGGKIAIWGSKHSQINIQSVLKAGLPCAIECEYRLPEPWAEQYGHTHWVPEDCRLQVLEG